MIIRRIAIVTVILFALATPLFLAAGVAGFVPAGPQAVSLGPGLGFGTWAFTGKDKAGVVWTGTLGIEKLDASQFDPQKYIAQGNLRIENAGGDGKGANPPDPVRSRDTRFHDGSGIGLRRGGLHRCSLARREAPDQGNLAGNRSVVQREGEARRQRGRMVGDADREVIPVRALTPAPAGNTMSPRWMAMVSEQEFVASRKKQILSMMM